MSTRMTLITLKLHFSIYSSIQPVLLQSADIVSWNNGKHGLGKFVSIFFPVFPFLSLKTSPALYRVTKSNK